MRFSEIAAAAALSAGIVWAQAPLRQTVVVTGSFEPVDLKEVDRAISVYAARDLALTTATVADLLKLDPSLDLRQRAPGGVQADLSIRGGTFGQTLVLVDGLRLNSAQSGHHNLDIPLSYDTLERVEVLKGAGSTLYGSDAIGGTVNLITKPPEAPEVRLRAGLGNFGTQQQRVSAAWTGDRWQQQLGAARDFSTGFRDNRDYRNLSLSSATRLRTALGTTAVTLGWNDRPFGADQFYGNFNSWENTKAWFAGVRQPLGEKTEAAFSWRRHSDLFVLYRDRPQVFTNRHADRSWQAALRRREEIAGVGTLHYGGEGFGDAIDSNNLGRHSRGRGAAYASLFWNGLKRWRINLGARQEVYSAMASQFSPSATMAFWAHERLKLRGGISRAFRIPTYTDLYYQDPGNRGSPDLRPERAWSFEGGADAYLSSRWMASATVFHRREQDGIDYVRRAPGDLWRAANIQQLRFTGAELSLRARLPRDHSVDLSYTGLHGAKSALGGLQSKYVFNYPVHAAVANWQGTLPGAIFRTRIGAAQRLGRAPYAVWEAYSAAARGRWRPFLQFGNLTNTRYEEITGVAMPGRTWLGGVEWRVAK